MIMLGNCYIFKNIFFNFGNNQIQSKQKMETLNHYFVEGIVVSGIFEDGGPQCSAQIPRTYHAMAALFGTIVHLFILYKWRDHLRKEFLPSNMKRSLSQTLFGLLGVYSLVMTCYYKISTGKGLFIFNPCHITLASIVIMLLAPQNTKSLQKFHTCWTSWLFGAMLALVAPHLQGISKFQVFLYYLEHLLILPIGPIILMRRYGFVRPTLMNQLISFTSLCLYQLLVLFPLSALTSVNLNFALCHSPADWTFKYVGYHYFTIAMFLLNVYAYFGRWTVYVLLIKPYESVVNLLKGSEKKDKLQ